MKKIIAPIDPQLMKQELTEDLFFCEAAHGNAKVYLLDNLTAPNVMKEIGRLREMAFRQGGGGTGEPMDLDRFDLDPSLGGYKQILLWDPERDSIIGGYRFVCCRNCQMDSEGQPIMPSSHLFTFSQRFLKHEFRNTIELSRSFISPEYQSTGDGLRQSVFALDNLLDAISKLPHMLHIKYFFGKMTIYRSFPQECLDMLQYFLHKYFPPRGKDSWLTAKQPIPFPAEGSMDDIFNGGDFANDYRILKDRLKQFDARIPPMINTYMNLSNTMQYFGGGFNDEFGDVIECGAIVKHQDILKERFKKVIDLRKLHHLRKLRKWILKG